MPAEVALAGIYLGALGISAKREWNTILWRFLSLFFHDLKILLGGSFLTTHMVSSMLQILAESGHVEDNSVIRENLDKWTSAGLRYDTLSKSLDDGAMFLLPQTITDKTYVDGRSTRAHTLTNLGGSMNYPFPGRYTNKPSASFVTWEYWSSPKRLVPTNLVARSARPSSNGSSGPQQFLVCSTKEGRPELVLTSGLVTINRSFTLQTTFLRCSAAPLLIRRLH